LSLFFLASGTAWAADNDGDGYDESKDCNDADASIYPGAIEVCDGVDNNCDGFTDEGVKTTWWQDADTDGYGDAGFPYEGCTKPPGFVLNSQDCNDSEPAINPAAKEICDGIDNNCNLKTDEGCDEDTGLPGDTGDTGDTGSEDTGTPPDDTGMADTGDTGCPHSDVPDGEGNAGNPNPGSPASLGDSGCGGAMWVVVPFLWLGWRSRRS